jgi:hypothetical protein
MGRAKLPHDAFEFYLALGTGRGYQAVAEHFGVSNWPRQVADREKDVQARVAQNADAVLDDVVERHLKLVRFVQRKALEKLRSLPMSTTAEAVRALDVAIKHERMILGVGDAEDQSALDMAEIVKRESERWLKTVDVPPGDGATSRPDQAP